MVEMKKAITIKLLFAFILAAGILLVSCGSPLHPQDLGKYLQDLFTTNEITLSEDDFFEPEEDLYLTYAKVLNLIPSSYQSDERITEKTAGEISEKFRAVKDFAVAYQDRILFGSDIILDSSKTKDLEWVYSRMRCDIYLHENVEYICDFGETEWVHKGFNLDKEVLRKLYYDNPKKILGF